MLHCITQALVWSDTDCPSLGEHVNADLQACKALCVANRLCTAINTRVDGGGCTLRACDASSSQGGLQVGRTPALCPWAVSPPVPSGVSPPPIRAVLAPLLRTRAQLR